MAPIDKNVTKTAIWAVTIIWNHVEIDINWLQLTQSYPMYNTPVVLLGTVTHRFANDSSALYELPLCWQFQERWKRWFCDWFPIHDLFCTRWEVQVKADFSEFDVSQPACTVDEIRVLMWILSRIRWRNKWLILLAAGWTRHRIDDCLRTCFDCDR